MSSSGFRFFRLGVSVPEDMQPIQTLFEMFPNISKVDLVRALIATDSLDRAVDVLTSQPDAATALESLLSSSRHRRTASYGGLTDPLVPQNPGTKQLDEVAAVKVYSRWKESQRAQQALLVSLSRDSCVCLPLTEKTQGSTAPASSKKESRPPTPTDTNGDFSLMLSSPKVVCEVTSPHPSFRLVMIRSSVRIFNKSGLPLEVRMPACTV